MSQHMVTWLSHASHLKISTSWRKFNVIQRVDQTGEIEEKKLCRHRHLYSDSSEWKYRGFIIFFQQELGNWFSQVGKTF